MYDLLYRKIGSYNSLLDMLQEYPIFFSLFKTIVLLVNTVRHQVSSY